MRIACTMIAVALALAACVTTDQIEGRRITATATIPTERSSIPDVYEDAPAEARKVWHRYLADAGGRYSVLAVDRNMRGAGWVYCVGGGCSRLSTNQFKSWKEVQYKHRALKFCRQDVRNNYPAERSTCAIFAIKDKIVWKGRMPWE